MCTRTKVFDYFFQGNKFSILFGLDMIKDRQRECTDVIEVWAQPAGENFGKIIVNSLNNCAHVACCV